MWRYDHLSQKDKITGVVTSPSPRKDGVLQTPLELDKEKTLFENAQLVDIGVELPFYEDYLAQLEGRQTTGVAQDSTHIALIATMVPLSVDTGLRHKLWTQADMYMNNQEEVFAPFDWGPTRLTESHLP